MAWLKYYEDENKRWPSLHATKCSRYETEAVIRRWQKEHLPRLDRPIIVDFTSGRRISTAFFTRIVFNTGYLNWLVVAHEFAHIWHKQMKPLAKSWHNAEHAELVDILCRQIVRENLTVEISHGIALGDNRRLDRAAAKPPPPPPWQVKINKRQEQIRRLERKHKTLETRLKKARRSLAALIRLHPNQ